MSILIAGASITHGDGLANPELSAWPTVFSRLSNQTVTNIARSGAGIDYVFYNVINQLSNNSFDGLIIAWPPLLRPLLTRRENNFLINGNVGCLNEIYGKSAQYKKYLELHYRYWTNELFDLKFSLQKILTLQAYLKTNNYKYLFINSDPYFLSDWLSLSSLSTELKEKYLDAFVEMNDLQILEEEKEISNLVNQFDLLNYHDPVGFNLSDMCKQSSNFSYTTKHPTEQGHIEIAKFVNNLWSQL